MTRSAWLLAAAVSALFLATVHGAGAAEAPAPVLRETRVADLELIEQRPNERGAARRPDLRDARSTGKARVRVELDGQPLGEGDASEGRDADGADAEGGEPEDSKDGEDASDEERLETRDLPTGGDKSGVTSQAISVPKGEGTVKGMGESFSAQLSTGIATFSVPLALLPARGAAQPELSLSYGSSGGHGVAGVGWSIGVPFIARQTDKGVPRYDDRALWHAGSDRFVFNGGQELVPICDVSGELQCRGSSARSAVPAVEQMPDWAGGWRYFRARVEGGFLRFFWSPDRLTWRVQDKSGVTLELGVPLDGSVYEGALELHPDDARRSTRAPKRVYRWLLVRKYDPYGARDASGNLTPVNVVQYRYVESGGMAVLSDIYDTSPAGDPTTTALADYAHHTRLRYEARPDPTESYRAGWRIAQRLRLVGLDVASKTFKGATSDARRLVRRYHLGYDATLHVSLLASMQVEGRCAASEADAPEETGDDPSLSDASRAWDSARPPGASLGATSCERLPPLRLGYSHVEGEALIAGYEPFDKTLRRLAGSPEHALDETEADLFDIDSDGLPDVLATTPGRYGGKHAVFFNGAGGVTDRFGASVPMAIRGVAGASASTLRLGNPNVEPLDLDGDGRVNLLQLAGRSAYGVFDPVCAGGICAWVGREVLSLSGQSPKLDFANENRATKVVDVNFDGLVDVLVSTGSELQTFFSLGRYPGGDGQFGQALTRSDGTVELTTEPMRACLPKAGTPVDLGDPELRLADLNGDGITDLVKLQPSRIIYWPGRGTGYFGTGDPAACAPGTFEQGAYVEMASAPGQTSFAPGELRVDDVNGDGLSDLVQVGFDAVGIWLNVDGVGFTKRALLRGVPSSKPFVNRVRLVDINGSGTADIVWGDPRDYQYIDLQGGRRAWLLTTIDNGLGKTSELEYRTSTDEMLAAARAGQPWTRKAPVVTSLVKRHVERDNLGTVAGLAARSYVTEYTYRDPLYDGQQREFRGFGYAEARRLGDDNSPTSLTGSTFLLGECVDEDATDGVDACSVPERWRDNPREALKGLPVVSETRDEAGVYLSTQHTAYRLRRLYQGLDGRDVRYAYVEATDTSLYDTASFTATSGATQSLVAVRVELGEGAGAAPGTGPEDASAVPLRATKGTARLRSRSSVDWLGNQTEAEDLGCLGGAACPSSDERLTKHLVPRLLDTPERWLWRTARSWVTGEAAFGAAHAERRGETITSFDAFGAPTKTQAVLTGTLPLERFHAATRAVAPAPEDASSDGIITLGRTSYDAFGHTIVTRGANGRCARLRYDEAFRLFATTETLYTGGCGALDGAADFSASGRALFTTAVYDAGLGAPVTVVNLQGRFSLIEYDELGRLVSLYRPHPGGSYDGAAALLDPADPETVAANGVCPLPSVRIHYSLPFETGDAYSRVRTETQDGKSCGEDAYLESYALIDGFGRTLVTLSEADPASPEAGGDGHAWIVASIEEYDAKAAVRRKYIPFFYDGAPTAFPLASTPKAQYGRQRYDAFGRAIQTYDVDGTLTLKTVYHALSTDLWDASDLAPGPHQGTYASARKDGHGRASLSTERVHVGAKLEERHVRPRYLPSGEVEAIERLRGAASAPTERVSRWMRFDSLGRMVLNAEPNTARGFSPDLAADAGSMKAWRYAYNDAGDLVGTSDARGCGVNFAYDAAGRLVGEDYSPCEAHHADYSSPARDGTGDGYEAFTLYDTPVPPGGVSAPPGMPSADSSLYRGAAVAMWDRGAATWTKLDGRGRAIAAYRQLARPRQLAASAGQDLAEPRLAARYAARWYAVDTRYDAADRVVWQTTGAETKALRGAPVRPFGAAASGPASASAVTTSYTARGKVRSVGGSYGPLVRRVTRTADDLVAAIVYGDIAQTETAFLYDERRRVSTVQTYRGPPAAWTTPNAIEPPTSYDSGAAPNTWQLLLQDTEYRYDGVGNPIEIRDWRLPEEWPDGAKPVTKKLEYDDLNRLQRIAYQYAEGDDTWTDPFAAEEGKPADALDDPRRAKPAPRVRFQKRVLWQTYSYDWLGNTTGTRDDANGFYERSLGTLRNGPATGPAYQLASARSPVPRKEGSALPAASSDPPTDRLDTAYDPAGNMTSLVVARGGECIDGVCSHRYGYDWDEVGRLVRARRWDLTAKEAAAAVTAWDRAAEPTPEVELRYTYDAGDQRVVKTAVDEDGDELHTAYIFASLELRRARFDAGAGEGSGEYERSALTEVGYLFANGVRLARLVFEPSHRAVPALAETAEDGGDERDDYPYGSLLHVFFELGDHLGSTSVVLDQATSELVEATTFLAYGATESDYRPARWGAFREDYRFTGKEEDSEVGLTYFGKRFLSAALGRWMSADPLAVHAPGEADLNLYAYVSGAVLKSVDPVGLANGESSSFCATASCSGDGESVSMADGNAPQAGVPAAESGSTFVPPPHPDRAERAQPAPAAAAPAAAAPRGGLGFGIHDLGKAGAEIDRQAAEAGAAPLVYALRNAGLGLVEDGLRTMDAFARAATPGLTLLPPSPLPDLVRQLRVETSEMTPSQAAVYERGNHEFGANLFINLMLLFGPAAVTPVTRPGPVVAAEGVVAEGATAPVGRLGSPLTVPRGTNAPAVINGRQFTGHALDQMQGRGLTPSVVEDTIVNGAQSAGREGATIFETNQARVILNPDGSVKTVMPFSK